MKNDSLALKWRLLLAIGALVAFFVVLWLMEFEFAAPIESADNYGNAHLASYFTTLIECGPLPFWSIVLMWGCMSAAAVMKPAFLTRWHRVLCLTPIFLSGIMTFFTVRGVWWFVATGVSGIDADWALLSIIASAKLLLLAGFTASVITWFVLQIRRRFSPFL